MVYGQNPSRSYSRTLFSLGIIGRTTANAPSFLWPLGGDVSVEEGPVGALPVSRAHNACRRFRWWAGADLHARLYLKICAYVRQVFGDTRRYTHTPMFFYIQWIHLHPPTSSKIHHYSTKYPLFPAGNHLFPSKYPPFTPKDACLFPRPFY
jgi:hypothetical protein